MDLYSKEAFLFGIFLIIISRILHFDGIMVVVGIALVVFGMFGNPFTKKDDQTEEF